MLKEEFINRVIHILNESDPTEGVELIGGDMTNVSLYIEKLFPAAWRKSVSLLPSRFFEETDFSGSPRVTDAPDGTGYIMLPDDFLKLSRFKMKGWKQSCMDAIESSPLVDRKQSNEYLRGTPQRPVCVLRSMYADGRYRKTLHYYSLPKSNMADKHVIEEASYIRNLLIMPFELPLSDEAIDPVAYLCAATVLLSFEKFDTAKALEARSIELMEQ